LAFGRFFCEGPFLLLFIMQAVMETLTWRQLHGGMAVAKPVFCTRTKGVTYGGQTFIQEARRITKIYHSTFWRQCSEQPRRFRTMGFIPL
jgi:hypothetical protein